MTCHVLKLTNPLLPHVVLLAMLLLSLSSQRVHTLVWPLIYGPVVSLSMPCYGYSGVVFLSVARGSVSW